MYRLDRISSLPSNFDEFVDEIARGLAPLYGKKTAECYRDTAKAGVLFTIRQPCVDALALFDGKEAAAMLFAAAEGCAGKVFLVHVLARYTGAGLEGRLIEEAVRTFRAAGVDAIVSDCVTFCPLDVDPVYKRLGFRRIERGIMAASLSEPALAVSDLTYTAGMARDVPMTLEAIGRAADVIVDAYQNHPGRDLHPEVRVPEDVRSFIRKVMDGEYGSFVPDYARVVLDGERDDADSCAGVVLGCEIAPDYGFVLQAAVRRERQSMGIGDRLIRGLAAQFRAHGMTHVALGVTLDSPAVRLYKRLGFDIVKPVNAYVWWRP